MKLSSANRKVILDKLAVMRRLLLVPAVGCVTMLAASNPQPFSHSLVFEPNLGQSAPEVTWLARGPGYQLFLTSDGATIVHRDSPAPGPRSKDTSFSRERMLSSSPESHAGVVRMKLKGSRDWNAVTGLEPTGGTSNYFLGNDSKQWRLDIPHYARLQAKGVYDGIDLVLYSHGGDLEYDFVVAPFADPKQIRLAFEGVEGMRVDGLTGDLLLTTSNGAELRQGRPVMPMSPDLRALAIFQRVTSSKAAATSLSSVATLLF